MPEVEEENETNSPELPGETIVHQSVIALLEMLSANYGIRIKGVNVEWIDVSTMGQMGHIIRSINLDTAYEKRGGEN